MEILAEAEWMRRADAHGARVDRWIQPHLARRNAGVKHPVHDFLFGYYAQSPSALRRWHPGFGVELAGGSAYAGLSGYQVEEVGPDGTASIASVTTDHRESRRRLIRQLHGLMSATARRSPTLDCFGLHEWAMVHRAPETRHAWPLRLGAAGTDAVVESHRIGCSHFDAFRFFTLTARPLNLLQPGRDDRADFEQPGCLHGGMDLYKHAYRLSPLLGSELVADCFALAWDIRILDMRAAPYDFTGLTLDPDDVEWTPVPIETPDGKREYVAEQRAFAERGQALRSRLIAECERLLG